MSGKYFSVDIFNLAVEHTLTLTLTSFSTEQRRPPLKMCLPKLLFKRTGTILLKLLLP